jgi:hypothetical protein
LASGEDVEWCYLIQLSGYKIGYDKRLVFEHLLPANRITWDYYLRLKQGICSGVCRLLSYHCLFRNPQAGSLFFFGQWFKGMIYSTLIYLKQKVVGFVTSKSKTNEEVLIAVIWEAKAKAYWRDGWTTFNHFNLLKKHIQ